MSNLSQIPGGFSVMPNCLVGFISDKAVIAFLKIYQCQHILEKQIIDDKEWIKLSVQYLCEALYKSKPTVRDTLAELTGLGFVQSIKHHRKDIFYRIDWDEIAYACEILRSVDNKGRNEIFNLCFGDEIIPISQLDKATVECTVKKYPNKYMLGKNFTEHEQVGSKIYPTSQGSEKNLPNFQMLGKNFSQHDNDNSYDTIVAANHSTATSDETMLGKNFTQLSNVGKKIYPTSSMFGKNFTPDIYIEEDNIKKNQVKRSFTIIGGENESFSENDFGSELPVIDKNNLGDFSEPSKSIAGLTSSSSTKEDWKEFRDLSYPSYEEREFESIIEDRNFNNTDEDKIIQLVWDCLSPSEHEKELDDVEEQGQQPDIIPVNEFYRNLYNIWSELKEQDKDFQLSEMDARNIFGFDVVKCEDEWCFVISSSKIKKLIKDEHQTSSERSSRNRGNRGVNGRASIRAFLDALIEIGNEDFQRLTKVEKAIYAIDQYSKEGRVVCESGFVREPHGTINQVNLPVMKKKWIEVSGMDEQDFNELLDGYKHKGGVYTLHATKLSPDFIISFNEKYDEDSEVEKIWSEKMAELS